MRAHLSRVQGMAGPQRTGVDCDRTEREESSPGSRAEISRVHRGAAEGSRAHHLRGTASGRDDRPLNNQPVDSSARAVSNRAIRSRSSHALQTTFTVGSPHRAHAFSVAGGYFAWRSGRIWSYPRNIAWRVPGLSSSSRWTMSRKRPRWARSEEHTSELQSLTISYAVFCLKKKK